MNAKLKLGDTGVVIGHERYNREPRPATIIKIGRKWATFRYDTSRFENRCDIETGAVDAGDFTSRLTFYTPERLAAHEAAEIARQTIRSHGLEVRGFWRDWPDDRLIGLAEWLESHPSKTKESTT